jgi:hypothetical protein
MIGGPGEIRQVLHPLGSFIHTAKAAVDSNTVLPTAIFFLSKVFGITIHAAMLSSVHLCCNVL